ncbi:hypothetical protein CEXT_548941, partial [Caerostris extrusa]
MGGNITGEGGDHGFEYSLAEVKEKSIVFANEQKELEKRSEVFE